MVDPGTGSSAPLGRSLSDVSTLLVELARVMKARQFYPPGHKNLTDLFERSFRAWKGELERNGELALEARPAYFVVTGSGEPLGAGQTELQSLAQEFALRQVRKIRFEPDIDSEAFQTVVVTMTTPPMELARTGGVERSLYACLGVEVNGVAGLGAKARKQEGDDAHQLDEASDDENPRPVATTREIESAPLEGQPSDPRALHLFEQLRELDECDSDASYDPLIESVVAQAVALFHEDMPPETYRTVVVLSNHAGDEAKRSTRQRILAKAALAKLCQEDVLEDLILRSSAPGAEASIRAAQILLQLGEPVVKRLFEALSEERHPERRGQLNGILIAMGPTALNVLHEILDQGDPQRVRLAVRLAGEIQSPDAVPRLTDLLASGNVSLRKEAAKALARIGNRDAVTALIAGLESSLPDIPPLAAYCLGATRNRRALEPLLSHLERALHAGEIEFAREVIRALGRLGNEGASEALAGILSKKSLFKKKTWQELKLAAAASLGRVPGEVSLSALTQAAGSTDARIRRAAQDALDRRAQASH